MLLRSALFDSPQARYSFVAARPFLDPALLRLALRIDATRIHHRAAQFGNPWQVLDGLMARYELLDEVDLPFPLGGCFGYWGYDLKNFVEPRLPRRAVNDLELPDCQVGFYDSLVAFDHRLGKTWIISTGLGEDGSRNELRARHAAGILARACCTNRPPNRFARARHATAQRDLPVTSNLSRAEFIAKVERAQRYIRAGDIYQVNLSHRLAAPCPLSGWEFFQQLAAFPPRRFRLISIAAIFKSPLPRRNFFCA